MNAEPSAASQIGGFILFGLLVLGLWCLLALLVSVAFSRVAARRGLRPRPPAPPQDWHLDACTRCTRLGILIRREQSSLQLVRVCGEHAQQGEREGWWATNYPFDRDAGLVIDEARNITRRSAS